MARLEYHLTYHEPQPGTRLIPFPGSAPFPVYLSHTPYLTASDFASAAHVASEDGAIIRAMLTPAGSAKVNHVGEQNLKAKAIYDYVGLLLHIDGQPARGLTMIYEPIPGYSVDIRGVSAESMAALVREIGK